MWRLELGMGASVDFPKYGNRGRLLECGYNFVLELPGFTIPLVS